jgi:hypothetical protein
MAPENEHVRPGRLLFLEPGIAGDAVHRPVRRPRADEDRFPAAVAAQRGELRG